MEKYCPKCFTKYPHSAKRCPQDGSFLVSTSDKDLTGETLDDRYTVLERIGRGGMGVVYRAEQQLIKRIVALKVLRKDIVQDESAVKRFLNEARAIASLDSRHTVTLHDFGVTQDGLLYYTMELLIGRPLSRIIRDESPVDHIRAADLILQSCRSLEEAHENNILHRDIKPDNLFVTLKKGREQLKVLDFGIAKLVGDTSMDTVTRTGMIIGTPQYLSPEQALGNAVVPASDLYSLAIVLYEMLAGKPPFAADTPMKTMWAHIRDPMPPLSATNPKAQVPRSIEAFLARSLEKEPGKRFQSVPAFAEALRKAVEDHDASPETVSLPPLSTTNQGLRLRAHSSEKTPLVEAASPSPEAPAKESPKESDSGTVALEHMAAVPPPRPKLKEKAEGTAREKPRPKPEPVVSKPLPKPEPVVAGSSEEDESTGNPAIPEPRIDRSAAGTPPPISADLTPGPRTLALVLPGRKRIIWGGGGAAALVLLVSLLVWAPWKGAPSDAVAVGADATSASPAAQIPDQAEAVKVGATFQDISEVDGMGMALTLDVADVRQALSLPDAKVTADASGTPEVSGTTDVTVGLDTPFHTDEVASPDSVGPTPQDILLDAPTQRNGSTLAAKEVRRKAAQEKLRKAEKKRKEARERADAKAAKMGDAEARERAEDEKISKAKAERREADYYQALKKSNAEKQKKAEAKALKKTEAEALNKAKDEARYEAKELVGAARRKVSVGQYSKAMDMLVKARALAGETAEIKTLIEKCMKGLRSGQIRDLLNSGKSAMQRKEFSKCISAAKDAMTLDAANYDAAVLLKECREKRDLDGMKF
jgi:eukaryotic-like serine/threonine-protein kinase